jgi:outer membrane protein assembly factor BamE (lipoprotein component of BamABCDE complex)
MQATMRQKLLLCAVLLSLAQCAPMRAVRGNFVELEQITPLKAGTSTKADVSAALGTPSTTDPFNPRTWIYIGEKTKQRAFFAPEIEARQIIVVNFNEQDILEKIEQRNDKTGKITVMAERKTPTAGHKMNAIQQMIGNIGKFNPGTGTQERTGSSRQ